MEQIKHHPFFYGVDWQAIRNIEAPFIPRLRSITDTSYFPTDELEQVPEEPVGGDTTGANKDLAFLGYVPPYGFARSVLMYVSQVHVQAFHDLLARLLILHATASESLVLRSASAAALLPCLLSFCMEFPLSLPLFPGSGVVPCSIPESSRTYYIVPQARAPLHMVSSHVHACDSRRYHAHFRVLFSHFSHNKHIRISQSSASVSKGPGFVLQRPN